MRRTGQAMPSPCGALRSVRVGLALACATRDGMGDRNQVTKAVELLLFIVAQGEVDIDFDNNQNL